MMQHPQDRPLTIRRPPPGTDGAFRVDPIIPNVIYLCQICGNPARYPRAKSHTFRLPFGFSWTVEYVTPMVCMNCRIARQVEAQRLGDGRRRFWKRFFALWLGETYPSMGPAMYRLLRLRQKLWGVGQHA